MKKTIIGMVLMAVALTAGAQDAYRPVLDQIEVNSVTLSALREQMKAQQLESRTGLNPANPEVEFDYMWGNPSNIGPRRNLNVTQSFDFPSAYVHKGRVAGMEGANAELLYRSERMALLLEAKKICIELVYNNALAKTYGFRVENAQAVAESFKKMYDAGEVNVLEYNNAQMSLAVVRGQARKIGTERDALLTELRRLNGDREISFDDDTFRTGSLPADFETWYGQAEAGNPLLEYVRTEAEIGLQNVKLERSMSLPKLSAGYMSEDVLDDSFKGFMVGMSIPLWENRNTVKRAKAEAKAAEYIAQDAKTAFYSKLKNLYGKAAGLQSNISDYRGAIAEFDNGGLLLKALEKGEISFHEYVERAGYFYEVMDLLIEAERDFELCMAELNAVEL